MDQKLLNALNNIGLALEELVDALNTKSEASTATGSAIQSGNFAEDLKSINEGIKSIKADTQTIIKNQQTIIAQGKERESAKTKDIETDPKKESDIKKGVGTILLIAVAVLAIGMAFKLVGDVNILSVIGLALGITLVAIAFEKVAELKLGLKEAAIAAAVMVIMSVGLMISSHILSLVQPVSPIKMLTAIFISAGFAVLGPSISKLVLAFKGMSIIDLIKTVIFLPLILPAISLGIALSSEFLQKVQPIGLSQFISSILISGIFVVLAFGLKKMMSAFKGIDPKTAAIAAASVPVMMIALSLAIWGSSEILQNVQPISLSQFFTSLFISIVFVALSFSLSNILKSLKGIDPVTAAIAAGSIPILMIAMSAAIWGSSEFLNMVVPITFDKFVSALLISIVFIGLSFAASLIIKQMKGIDPKTLATAVIGIPLLMVAMSVAIWLSSIILDNMTIVSEDKLINAGLVGAGLAILAIAMAPTIKVLSKIGIGEIIKGALIIPILAAAVMVSSLILNLGTYENYPGLGWVAGVSLSLLTFGLGALALGAAVFGPQALVFAAGLGAILVVAGIIVGVSHILKAGKYDNPGMLEWAAAVSLLYLTFTPIMLILGAAALASAVVSLFGPDPWKMAQTAIEDVAKTIVSTSIILSEGYTDKDGNKVKPNYKGGPTKEWADGISVALGAFSPIYGMLMANAIFSIFGGGGVGPDDFTNAIKTVSQGIVSAANFFASPENPGVWAGHPTKEWAEGVGLAIGAFAPVYEILAKNSGWFSSGVSPEDFAGKFDDSGKLIKDGAIQVIARGIISAAKFFAENTSPFEEGMYPSKNWGEGVGASLGAFAPVFDMLMEKSGFWKSGDSVINDMVKGIVGVSTAIVRVAKMFSSSSKGNIFEVYPKKEWGDAVNKTIHTFTDIAKYLEKEEAPYWRITNVVDRMTKVAKTLFTNSDAFSKTIDPNFISNLSKNMLDFNQLVKELTASEDEGMLSRFGNNLLGTDPIMQIAKRMITLAEGYDKLADSLIKLGGAMKVLNITDIRMLGGLSPALAKPDESKKGGLMDSAKSLFGFKKAETGPTVGTGDKGVGGKESSLKEDMAKIIKLLTNIDKSTEESSISLSEMLVQLRDEGVRTVSAGN
jgi:hypothetical protein